MLTTDLSDSGYIINHQLYRSPFGMASTSLHHLEAISKSITQPNFGDTILRGSLQECTESPNTRKQPRSPTLEMDGMKRSCL